MRAEKNSIKSNKIKCPNCITSQIFFKYESNKFQIYFCKKCLNGFTYPIPKNLDRYYSDSYWIPKGLIGILKDTFYHIFQIRRKYWILNFLKNGEILDVGSGEGIFSKLLGKNFKVTSLDIPSAKIVNPEVIKADFLKWNPGKKFDAIVFWESLEHTAYPQKYIKKAASILKPEGYIFIEFPRYDCWEASLFKNLWFHLDPPRHLSHLTPNGLNNLLPRTKLTTIYRCGVFALEYTIGGFVASILNLFSKQPVDFFQSSKNLLLILPLIPLIFISTLIEILFFLLGQSPIFLTVVKKGRTNIDSDLLKS